MPASAIVKRSEPSESKTGHLEAGAREFFGIWFVEVGISTNLCEPPGMRTQKTPPLPCITVPLNFLETGGTRRVVFDVQ